MNVFDVNQAVLEDYEAFSRSFVNIKADDLARSIESAYLDGRYTPEPLVSINPNFEPGVTIEALAREGVLHPDTDRIFRANGETLRLHRHQQQAIGLARDRRSYVVTTGTGSGKSLCYFVPIVDEAVRDPHRKTTPRTRAIIVYPMNALANSQVEEIDKFLRQAGLDRPPRVAIYTGQENEAARKSVADDPPDILLTNFVMLELLMTRGDPVGRRVIENCRGLDWLVLDELHTYRGRQGADVAMLVRRIRERLGAGEGLRCVGTSATMASGSEDDGEATVAAVASRIFGAPIDTSALVKESLERRTVGEPSREALVEAVRSAKVDGTDEELKSHPLVVWLETRVGLEDGLELKRRPPCGLTEAAGRLAEETGLDREDCRKALVETLLGASRPQPGSDGAGERAFLAFKLHQFVSGPENLYATLAPPGERRTLLEKQRFHPDEPDAALFETHFCRVCGQEYHPVRIERDDVPERFVARSIDEPAIDDEDEVGFLMVEPADLTFAGAPEDYPDSWTEPAADGSLRLKDNRRKRPPRRLAVRTSGALGEEGDGAVAAWYMPGQFSLCLSCLDTPSPQGRDKNRLSGLSAEGRSSATTTLATDLLVEMTRPERGVAEDKRKLLAFTDNRQDASLQAGHFNDTIFVAKLRAGVLAALRKAGEEGLDDEVLGRRVREALGYGWANRATRGEWMADPDAKGAAATEAERTLTRVLAHRAWADQRRGWRYTNPNLEDLGLLRAEYPGLDELAEDLEAFRDAPTVLVEATPQVRRQALWKLLEAMRRDLAIDTEALDRNDLDGLAQRSRQSLAPMWAFPTREEPREATWLLVRAQSRKQIRTRDEAIILRAGIRSRLGRQLATRELWGQQLKTDVYEEVLLALLRATAEYSLTMERETPFGERGWRLQRNAVRLLADDSPAGPDGRPPNPYFRKLYERLAEDLASGKPILAGIEAREHTAQVEKAARQHRERRFRFKDDDIRKMAEEPSEGEPSTRLPVLVCSPTMELGVDISALDVVYMRNVPPTPANYTQRAGRAGRAGQAALILTYCAAQSPHDRYYFRDTRQMVHGVVKPPSLDLKNEELVRAHLHAVWLGASGVELDAAIANVLDMEKTDYPVREEIVERLARPSLKAEAVPRMIAVLEQIAEGAGDAAGRPLDRRFAEAVAEKAFEAFDTAFDSWRERLRGAEEQLRIANEIQNAHGVSQKERDSALQAYNSAARQIQLLRGGRETISSDFFTYRYLATEGFLPGYNFPRLPLTAFIPGRHRGQQKGDFLTRARFLAISEFGPMSLVYHEGHAYRVRKAIMPPEVRDLSHQRLTTETLIICPSCGALQHSETPERCEACDRALAEPARIDNAFRIQNVETAPAERITANDEERQRQGFEVQTTFAWNARERLVRAEAVADEAVLARIVYGPATRIVRVNKGLRRRRDKGLLGFRIGVQSGRWAGSADKPGEDDNENPLHEPKQRIVPMVEDRKNAVLLRFESSLGTPEMATLQSAFARGIALAFQLEEGEIAVEPVPDRDDRQGLLIYESAEGGAGALAQLAVRPDAVAEVAALALSQMHYRREGDDWIETDDACVAGCYSCLLSYYNQPDHELIDRQLPDARSLLERLAKAKVRPTEDPDGRASSDAPPVEAPQGDASWAEAAARWGLLQPDTRSIERDGRRPYAVWRDKAVAVTDDDDLAAALEAEGFEVVKLPAEPPAEPPEDLVRALGAAEVGE